MRVRISLQASLGRVREAEEEKYVYRILCGPFGSDVSGTSYH